MNADPGGLSRSSPWVVAEGLLYLTAVIVLLVITAGCETASPSVRMSIAPQLPRDVPSLITSLKNEDSMVRARAAEALGNLGGPAREAIPALVEALKDTEWKVRSSACDALVKLRPSPSDVVPLINQATGAGDLVHRANAVYFLGAIGAVQGVVPALANALGDPDPRVAMEAAIAIARIGPEAQEAIPALTNSAQPAKTQKLEFRYDVVRNREGVIISHAIPVYLVGVDRINNVTYTGGDGFSVLQADGSVIGPGAYTKKDVAILAADALRTLNARLQEREANRVLEEHSKAVEQNPNDANAYNVRGFDLIIKGDYDLALRDLNRAIELDPKLSIAYVNRGQAYLRKREYDRAILDYDKALELDPGSRLAYLCRSTAYKCKGDYAHALEDCNKVIDLNPQDALGYNNRAVIWFALKNYDNAWADIRRCRARGSTPDPSLLDALRKDSGRDD